MSNNSTVDASNLCNMELPATFDAHVHLREGAMSELVVPSIRRGGVDTVYVMPNLVPPITTVAHALEYRAHLQKLEPNVNFLMSLYLHPSITPQTVRLAKANGIKGIKSYPAGVTTNSSSGVTDYSIFYPVLSEMEKCGMILNLHGEAPSGGDVTILNAEKMFLPTLLDLHRRFPTLKIVLEHCTTAEAVEAVKLCPNVAGSITAHHLFLTAIDWIGEPHDHKGLSSPDILSPFNYCKPVAKTPRDREALLKAATSGHPRFFFGSDSAPHPVSAKAGSGNGNGNPAAGVFTQPYVTSLVLDAFESGVREGLLSPDVLSRHILTGFLSSNGRAFYNELPSEERVVLGEKNALTIVDALTSDNAEIEVVNFRRGQPVRSVLWS